jgi:hypothetical protein
MTRVILNGTIKGLRGKIGNMIFRQLPDGTTVVTAAPPRKTRRQKKRDKLKRSARQQAHNSRFQEATAYARQAAKVQPVYAELAAVTPMKTAYNFALSDWWHAPEIHRVEQRDGRILVEATDNIMVAKVYVTIFDEAGEILEMGDAVRQKGDWWEFALRHTDVGKTVKAEAWDLPGHMTTVVG